MPGQIHRYGPALAQGVIALPLGFALAGMPLAMAGLFRPLPVLAGTCVAAAGVAAVWGPVTAHVRRRSLLPVALVLAVVAVVTAANAGLSAQHVLTDRDPGSYTVTARWLATEHELLVAASSPAFGGSDDLRHHGYGFYPDAPGDRLYPQFLHLFPAVLAVADWIGGSWLLTKANAVIAGLALLMVFAFAARLTGPWPAVLAVIGLAATLPFTYFARDAYSELLTMAFLMGGLWLLWYARASFSARRGLVAGLVLGATCMVRIDSFVYLIPLTLYLACELLLARGSPVLRRRSDRFVAAVAAGIALSACLGVLDGLLFSRGYIEDHRGQLEAIAVGIAVAVVLAVLALVFRGPLERRGPTAGFWRPLVANSGAVAVLVLGAFAYFVRPRLAPAVERGEDWDAMNIASIQRAQGLPVDGARTYAESSMTWLVWYLGPVTVALGVIGAALLVRRVVLAEDRRALPFLLVFLTSALLYLWKPSIYPDHIWASRRFLPVVIPGLFILCFWTIRLGWDKLDGVQRGRAAGRAALALAAAAAVALPVSYLGDLSTQRGTQVPLAYETERLCERLPDRAAVAVHGEDNLDNVYIQTVQVFCGVPVVATPPDTDLATYRELDRRVRQAGHRLHVVSRSAAPFRPPPSGADQVFDVNFAVLEQTLTRRPSRVHEQRFSLFLTPISPPGGD